MAVVYLFISFYLVYLTFSSILGLEALSLFEVLEDFDGAGVLEGRVLGAVEGPDELLRGAESLVPERHGRVDDVLAVAADHHEATVRVVGNRLRVDLARTHVFRNDWDTLAIFYFCAWNGVTIDV